MKSYKVAIVAGESSGDLHGAHLAAGLKSALPSAELYGIGGRRMSSAGVRLLFDSSSWSAIGVSEALKAVPRLIRVLQRLRAYLKTNPPDLLVLIDFSAFNLRLVRNLPDNIKVLYYFPPGSWNRQYDYSRLKGIADRVVTPFPWSAKTLKEQGIHADYFGHPLLDIVSPLFPHDQFCDHFGFTVDHPIIGLLPGSRRHEIIQNLPCLLAAAARMLKANPNLQFAIPLALSISATGIHNELAAFPWVEAETYDTSEYTNIEPGEGLRPRFADQVRSIISQEGIDPNRFHISLKILPGMTYDVLAHSRAAVVTSGTATVEAAILGCPMVIIYRGSRLMALEYKLRRKSIKHIGMPNIILDRHAVPELRNLDATPEHISELMIPLIADSSERSAMLSTLDEVKALLGESGANRKTVQAALEMLGIDK